jgi:hypothetical protein
MPPNPPIRILFHGLIMLRSSEDGKSCIGEVHREPEYPHTLSVEVRMKVSGEADLILLRHFDKLSPEFQGLQIKIEGAEESPVQKYVPFSALNPFETKPDETNRQDFGWVLNMESRHFHDQTLLVKTAKTRPGVAIQGGDCYLHTAFLKRDVIDVVKGDGSEPRRLQGLATVVGANLFFGAGSAASITCDRFPTLTLQKPHADSGISYEVYVDNSPLYEPPESETHDEMEEYYRAVEKSNRDDIPPEEQFRLIFHNAGAASPNGSGEVFLRANRASIRIPCMPVALDGDGDGDGDGGRSAGAAGSRRGARSRSDSQLGSGARSSSATKR